MTLSGNAPANAILTQLGGDKPTRGVQHVTQMLRELGLENTFLAAPLVEDPKKSRPNDIPFISTPARENATDGSCIDTHAAKLSQTTTKDLATLFHLIYQCAEYGGGGLVAAYPTEITQQECKMMIDLMEHNTDGSLIGAGVPSDSLVAHKHGWVNDTVADSGIVYAPSGDYVMSIFLWGNVTDWMPAATTFPVIEGISTATFNYFNPNMVNTPRNGLGDLLNIDLSKTEP
jgi:beta-lactamase class A